MTISCSKWPGRSWRQENRATFPRHSTTIWKRFAAILLPDVRPAQTFFHHVLGGGRIPDAQKTWQWLTSHALTDDKLAGEYVDFLVKYKEYEAALQAWTGQLGQRTGEYPALNRLFNADFETETTGTTFDWKISQAGGVEVERDSAVARQGI